MATSREYRIRVFQIIQSGKMDLFDKEGRLLPGIHPMTGDDAVKYMPKTDWKRLIGMDTLFGQCGIKGFSKESERVVNRPLQILTHTNIFKDDFIEQIMLPYLNANNGIGYIEARNKILKG